MTVWHRALALGAAFLEMYVQGGCVCVFRISAFIHIYIYMHLHGHMYICIYAQIAHKTREVVTQREIRALKERQGQGQRQRERERESQKREKETFCGD